MHYVEPVKIQEQAPYIQSATTTQPQVEVKVLLESKSVEDIVRGVALEYGVPFNEMWGIMGCETGNTYNPRIQSGVMQSYGREESYGLSQIHLRAHTTITKEQATDPKFAAVFMAKHWESRRSMWYTCSRKALAEK